LTGYETYLKITRGIEVVTT